MFKTNHYKIFSVIFVFLSFFSFFVGFYLDENSAGGGNYTGDFSLIWKNLQLFINNDILTAINDENYSDSRTPIAYILHKILNPFVNNQDSFRKSVFVISLSLPFIFFICLKQKFKDSENLLLILISSMVLLSPYFRTSAFWGLQENYGLVFLLLSFFFLNKLLINKTQKNFDKLSKIILVTLFSSVCLYFDQKLIIIPIICFIKILCSDIEIKHKLFTLLFYTLFSLPYFFLIYLWGNLIPPEASYSRNLGGRLFFENIGYTSTIIAFYLFPLLLFKKDNIMNLFKINYKLLSFPLVYIVFLLIFFDFENQAVLGKGIIHKSSLLLFSNVFLQQIYTYIAFFLSWFVILTFMEKNFINKILIFYFFTLSVIIWPLLQEYFDPLIILLAFTFFNFKISLTYRNTILLFLYFSLFLISSNIYYINLFS